MKNIFKSKKRVACVDFIQSSVIFDCIIKVQLAERTYHVIKTTDLLRDLIHSDGDVEEATNLVIEKLVSYSFKKDVKDFLCFDTVEERLKNQPFLSTEYLRYDNGWGILNYVPGDYSLDGHLKSVYFLLQKSYKNIERYNKDKEKSKIQKDIAFALSTKYFSIYHVDLDKNLYQIQQITSDLRKDVVNVAENSDLCFSKAIENYINNFVSPEDVDYLKSVFQKSYIINRFKTESNFSIRYKVRPNAENQNYFEIYFVNTSVQEDEHIFVIAWRCVDDVMQHEFEYQRLLKLTLEETNAIYHEVLKLQSNGIIAYYSDSKEILVMNDAVFKIFGAQKFDFKNETFDRIDKYLKIPEFKHLLKVLNNLTVGEGVFSFDFKICHSDGTFVNVMAQAKMVESECNRNLILISFVDITEKVCIEEKLRYLSETDSLTQLPNRASGEKRINQIISEKNEGAFCILDVDDFKRINDSFGHAKGDEVLKGISQSLKKVFNGENFSFRLGGDEFAVFVQNLKNQKEIEKIFGKFEKEIENYDFSLPDEIKVRVSMGIVLKTLDDTFDSLYLRADEAMYKCKKDKTKSMCF